MREGSQAGSQGLALLPSLGIEVNLHYPSALQRPTSRSLASEAIQAASTKGVRLEVGAGEKRAQSDDLHRFLLLLIPQDSWLPDLPPSLK